MSDLRATTSWISDPVTRQHRLQKTCLSIARCLCYHNHRCSPFSCMLQVSDADLSLNFEILKRYIVHTISDAGIPNLSDHVVSCHTMIMDSRCFQVAVVVTPCRIELRLLLFISAACIRFTLKSGLEAANKRSRTGCYFCKYGIRCSID